jgi:hypothetical protein
MAWFAQVGVTPKSKKLQDLNNVKVSNRNTKKKKSLPVTGGIFKNLSKRLILNDYKILRRTPEFF